MLSCTRIASLHTLAHSIILIIVAAIIVGQNAMAQTIDVPIDVQCRLFGQILQFDLSLRSRAGDTLIIAIVFQKDFRDSKTAKEECQRNLNEIAKKPIQGLPVRIETIDLTVSRQLDSQLVARQVDVIFVTPLRAYPIDKLITASRKLKTFTMSTVTGYVEDGLSVGIGLKDNKPEIVVNLLASRLEGSDLSAKLLKFSRIVGEQR